MIHHPQTDIILKYTEGELIPSLASMIASHLEVCDQCRMHYKEFLQQSARHLESGSVELSGMDVDRAFNMVMEKLDQQKFPEENRAETQQVQINVSGQLITLPRSMNFLKDEQIIWKEFGKKNAIAPLVTGPKGNLYLIYIGPGESVPQHNHTGVEYSYVAAGSYNDGISTFNTGDFSISSDEVSHSPRATSEDGCLVISWVEGRLNYFDGWLKPLNSLLWWYLHRA
jgi:putative transcriptional regulator